MSSISSHNPSEVPAPVDGYAQTVSVTGVSQLVFVSGQIPQLPDGDIPEGFEAQCRLAWQNVRANLRATGLDIGDLAKVNIYLTDRSQVDANRAIRREVFGEHRPASTVVIVQTLDPRWLLEIEAVAVR